MKPRLLDAYSCAGGAGMDVDGVVVRHRCDNRPCVNPAHLEVGSQEENVADMTSRSRQSRGSGRPLSKLSEDDIPTILARLARGERQRDIAEDYGVSRSLISMVKTGRIWTHAVTPPAARDLISCVVESLEGAA